MLDHMAIFVRDYPSSKAFYTKALAPLGIRPLKEYEPATVSQGGFVGFGFGGKPSFWIGVGDAGAGVHLAFSAGSRAAVDAFFQAAVEAGAEDNGAPRLRPEYHLNYYGAFVIDPNGINLEAVCHAPEEHAAVVADIGDRTVPGCGSWPPSRSL